MSTRQGQHRADDDDVLHTGLTDVHVGSDNPWRKPTNNRLNRRVSKRRTDGQVGEARSMLSSTATNTGHCGRTQVLDWFRRSPGDRLIPASLENVLQYHFILASVIAQLRSNQTRLSLLKMVTDTDESARITTISASCMWLHTCIPLLTQLG